ncbi:MAG: chemotaxis protein CheD [Bacteroidota bacterium]
MTQKKHFLMTGQMLITTVPTEIITVLGSCISVCLWDNRLKMAGMNHYLLPGHDREEAGNANRGHSSIRMLIRSMLNRQSSIEHLEAKIFGGSNSLYLHNDQFEVGKRNIEVALQVLKEYNIRLVANQTGGCYGRKIIFNTSTGKVRMKLLKKSAIQINEEIHKGFGV